MEPKGRRANHPLTTESVNKSGRAPETDHRLEIRRLERAVSRSRLVAIILELRISAERLRILNVVNGLSNLQIIVA